MSPSYFRGRRTITTVITLDDGTVQHVTPSQWSQEDRALMVAWRIYRDSLCPDCSQPRGKAWHPDMNGWYEVELVECQACTAVDSRFAEERGDGDGKPKWFPMVRDTRDYEAKPLPALPSPRRRG